MTHWKLNGVWCSGASSCHFARCSAAARAASVLGVNLQTLSDCVFSPVDATDSVTAIDRLENFVSVLYSELLLSLTCLINRLVSVDFSCSLSSSCYCQLNCLSLCPGKWGFYCKHNFLPFHSYNRLIPIMFKWTAKSVDWGIADSL